MPIKICDLQTLISRINKDNLTQPPRRRKIAEALNIQVMITDQQGTGHTEKRVQTRVLHDREALKKIQNVFPWKIRIIILFQKTKKIQSKYLKIRKSNSLIFKPVQEKGCFWEWSNRGSISLPMTYLYQKMGTIRQGRYCFEDLKVVQILVVQ